MTAAPVRPGDVLAGKYRVDRVLGAGGMGVVVAATHLHLEQRVALKFLLPELARAGTRAPVTRSRRRRARHGRLRRVHDVREPRRPRNDPPVAPAHRRGATGREPQLSCATRGALAGRRRRTACGAVVAPANAAPRVPSEEGARRAAGIGRAEAPFGRAVPSNEKGFGLGCRPGGRSRLLLRSRTVPARGTAGTTEPGPVGPIASSGARSAGSPDQLVRGSRHAAPRSGPDAVRSGGLVALRRADRGTPSGP